MLDSLTDRYSIPTGAVFIGGRWVPSADKGRLVVNNPKDGGFLAEVAAGSVEDAQYAVESAHKAFREWSLWSAIDRAALLEKVSDLMEGERDYLVDIAMAEHGKVRRTAHGEVDFAQLILRYVAGSARHVSGEIRYAESRAEQIWTQRAPYGVVAGLTPWNFPLVVAVRKLAPALMTGNTIVLKPHELTPLATLVLGELCRKAGVPDGVVNVVLGDGRTVGSALVTDSKTKLVSMTGSSRAGQEIYALCAPALKAVRLELGGKAPFMVMEDANVDVAVTAAVRAKFFAGGQACTANDRMYLHERIFDEFMDKFVEKTKKIIVGDPELDVDIGPWISKTEVDKLNSIASSALDDGAEVLYEQKPTDAMYEKGNWTFPKVFAVNSNSPRIMRDESFGPMVAALKVSDFDEALSYAHQTQYGLSAYLFTDSNRRILRCVNELEFGEVFINRTNGESVHGFHTGYGLSGIGGEDGIHGIDGYLRKKTMYNNFG